jgi:hypothetical protein
MTFARSVFMFAIVMLLVGIFGTRYLLGKLFAEPPAVVAVTHSSPTATARPHPSSTPTPRPHPSATATNAPVPTVTPIPMATATAIVRVRVRRAPVATATAALRMPTATATPFPTSSPTAGTVTLARYWVGSLQARPGQTIAIGYVIDNETGRTMRLMLGASIKSNRVLNWVSGALNDPAHDVVGTIPPGTTTHTRFFTLPAGLRPGHYDVAWGLRDAATGARAALVAAPSVLHVVG